MHRIRNPPQNGMQWKLFVMKLENIISVVLELSQIIINTTKLTKMLTKKAYVLGVEYCDESLQISRQK